MKTLTLILFASILLMPCAANATPSPQGRGNSDQGSGNRRQSNPVHAVPEPSTLILLGAAAGIAGARKLWQQRRSR